MNLFEYTEALNYCVTTYFVRGINFPKKKEPKKPKKDKDDEHTLTVTWTHDKIREKIKASNKRGK